MLHNLHVQRQQLIDSLRQAGVHDECVLAALTSVPRERFLEESLANLAYVDQALPIAMGQTISQPLMVAIMTQALALTGKERVLEIGTGSGYQTAILAQLAAEVYSVERFSQLAYQAAYRLSQLNFENVSIFVGDGSLGWPDMAPYDRILVTAAAPEIPFQLLSQVCMGGSLVIPVGSHQRQALQVVQRVPEGVRTQHLGQCLFVPLVGEEGWHEEP